MLVVVTRLADTGPIRTHAGVAQSRDRSEYVSIGTSSKTKIFSFSNKNPNSILWVRMDPEFAVRGLMVRDKRTLSTFSLEDIFAMG